ncbi:MAG TPA: SCO family protein [Phnomibacter sp.]|nr:SCO family protein [Phnomibacter sp.]
MNKTAFRGLLIALILPIGSYYIVKLLGAEAVDMPRKYFADTVQQVVKDGKTTYDTTWHTIPNFTFTNQLGKPVSLSDLKGKIVVVNTFFTRCPNICPGLTRNIRKLQSSFENPKRKKFGDTSIVYFLSISIDPQRDSVQHLKKWADRFFVNSDSWSLLTGERKSIYDLMLNDFKLATQDGEGVDSNFIHSEKVMLLDRTRVVRGYYNGLDSVEMGHLAEDIGKLYLERDKNKPSVFREYIPILPVLAAVPLIVMIGMFFLNRGRRKEKY